MTEPIGFRRQYGSLAELEAALTSVDYLEMWLNDLHGRVLTRHEVVPLLPGLARQAITGKEG